MSEYFKKYNDNTVLGFLSPEGEFSYCHSFEHLSMSEEICKEKGYFPYDKNFNKTNCIEKERYLHDLGYMIFRTSDVAYCPFCTKEYMLTFCDHDNVPLINLITKAQHDFINKHNELLDWHSSAQLESLNNIISYDDMLKDAWMKDLLEGKDEIRLNPNLITLCVKE